MCVCVSPYVCEIVKQVSVPSLPLPPACEREKVAQDVDRDRRYVIDASLTRIMKSRKVLPHQQLISECVEQLSRTFKVTCKDKKA